MAMQFAIGNLICKLVMQYENTYIHVYIISTTIHFKSALGKHCPEPAPLLPSSNIVISSEAFSSKGVARPNLPLIHFAQALPTQCFKSHLYSFFNLISVFYLVT